MNKDLNLFICARVKNRREQLGMSLTELSLRSAVPEMDLINCKNRRLSAAQQFEVARQLWPDLPLAHLYQTLSDDNISSHNTLKQVSLGMPLDVQGEFQEVAGMLKALPHAQRTPLISLIKKLAANAHGLIK